MKIWHNNRCSKSRETLKILTDKKVELEIVHYLETPPNKQQLEDVLSKLGIKAEELVRKDEEIFKANYAGKKMTEAKWIAAMVKYPKLIQRPIVIKGQKAVIGRPPETVLDLI